MNNIPANISHSLKRFAAIAAVAIIASLLPNGASALSLDTYAPESRLANGRWVKISVAESGIHTLTPAALKQMGFSDMSKVRIFGYGAVRQPEKLDSTYVDDLPELATLTTAAGIHFYAVGPVSWVSDRPVQNPYTTLGYYFITDSPDIDTPRPQILTTATPGATDPKTTFTHHLHYEQELVSPGATGHILVGESFASTRSRSYKFTLTDRASVVCRLMGSFVARASQFSTITWSVDGTDLPYAAADRIGAISDGHAHYIESLPAKTFTTDKDEITIGVKYNCATDPSLANLNYIAIAYDRKLHMRDKQLMFSLSGGAALSGANSSTVVWDITTPGTPLAVDGRLESDRLTWTPSSSVSTPYVAFDSSVAGLAPKYAGTVANQNLHSLSTPDMVIFAPKEFLSQANRLAERRRSGPDALDVAVIDQQEVFNEFSSGAPDVQSFRKMLKMLYDRGLAGQGRKLRFALFFGRGTYDNRQLTSAIKATGYPKMPIWQTDRGTSDSDSYTTDDIFAFLADNSGVNLSSDSYLISVGRLPVTSTADANNAINKIIDYEDNQTRSNWRNRVLLVADDEDLAEHMKQTERMWNWMEQSYGGSDVLYDKLYIDLYPREGKVAQMAHDKLIKSLEEGVAWFTYIGHANTTSLSHESLLTYTDILNLHLRRYPIMYAATCEFLRWDDSAVSAAEIMWKLTTGGAIAVISANRPVYISDNGPLSEAFGRHMFRRHDDGQRLTLGEIYSSAKNDYQVADRNGNYSHAANANKLRYVLLGDPSMRPVVPQHCVRVDSINSVDLNAYPDQAVMAALQDARICGHITDVDGNPLDSFNGTLNLTLYDAETSYTTLGLGGDNGIPTTYDTHGARLYEGYFPIKDSKFDISLPMPSEIAGNFRQASLSMYAYPTDKSSAIDAAGVENRFYVFGRDNDSQSDTIPPVIHSFYINHSSFTDGATVNTSPVAIAEISDNRAINMSSTGIGHQMILKLDGDKTYSDVSQYFTAATDGSPSGTIAYPLDQLAEGTHTLMLRVWDSAGNSATAQLSFTARDGVTPKLYDVFSDANPASVEANFYLSHDRPDAMIDVTVSVYNLMGRPVWSTTRSGRSDVFLSFPVTWDLTDMAGRRVPRGIYLYRASITSEGHTSETVTHKIAVTAPQ